MGGYRAERIAELIHLEVAQRLRLEVKDERVTDVSITAVVVSRDLKRAVIHYLPLGQDEGPPELQAGLDQAARSLRGPVGRALRLRHAPELRFEPDRHSAPAIAVTRLLDQLASQRSDDSSGGAPSEGGSEEEEL